MAHNRSSHLPSPQHLSLAIAIALTLLLPLGVTNQAVALTQGSTVTKPQPNAAGQKCMAQEEDPGNAEDDAKAENKEKENRKGKKDNNKKKAGQGKKNDDENDHESRYFGIITSGKTIIYVLDNSNSMNGEGRFNAAAAELLRSVKNLNGDQSFYVVLFSDTAYRLGHPAPAKSMLKPTEENIKKLEYWLSSVELCLRTNAAPALEAALKSKPDTIYLLTDGVFTDDTMKMLNGIKPGETSIHTIGMTPKNSKATAKKNLTAIANRFGGEFREVKLDKNERKKFLKPKRKTNKTRGQVWGVTLDKAN